MKKQYLIIINGSDFSHSWGEVTTVREARKLASEIARSGCSWLFDVKLLSADLIRGRITIDVYSGDELRVSKKLTKELRKELLKWGVAKGWYSGIVIPEFELYNS